MRHQRGMQLFLRVLCVQFAIQVIFSLVLVILAGLQASTAFIIGGLVNILPNACFARMLFRESGALAAKEIVKGFYKGEATKIGLTAVLFALLFKYFSIMPGFLFLGFILAQLTFIMAPQFIDHFKRV